MIKMKNIKSTKKKKKCNQTKVYNYDYTTCVKKLINIFIDI